MRRISFRVRKPSSRALLPVVMGLEDRQLLSSIPLSSASSTIAMPGPIGRPLTPAQEAAIPFGYTLNIPSASPEGGNGSAAVQVYTPAQIRHAYGVNQLTQDGTGQTIGIIDAYDLSSTAVANDLTGFDNQFGLPAANLTVATPQGIPTQLNAGWDLEIELDVEWAHAIAPGAKILLVEDDTASDSSLLAGVNYAIAQGANQVSMSWGSGEYSTEMSDNTTFANHPGVTFTAATGDSPSEVSFPAVSPYVTSVGGTTLNLDTSGNIVSESAWADGGGGTSAQFALPSYQSGFLNSTNRGTPDVSFDADPNTGFYVYNGSGWLDVGGTSAGTPQWAGLVALANQGRATLGESPLGTGLPLGINSVLYQLAGGTSYTNATGDYHDITTGTNGHPATTGYDLATGLGTPVANLIVPGLIGAVQTASVPTVSDAGFESVVVGNGNYAYDPTGSAWTFSGSAGVTANNSGFTSGNPSAPQGSQVGFLQNSGTITQSVSNFAAGSYTIAFNAAQRGNDGVQAEDFAVLVDGAVVSTFKPSGKSYQAYTTASFTVTAGSHTIEFEGLDSVGGDNTALIDAVSIGTGSATTPPPPPGPTVGDAGFESVFVGTGNYAYDPTGSAWTFSGSAGVSGNGSGFTSGNPSAPEGLQVGILQNSGTITQSVSGFAAGSYTISFNAAQRGNDGVQAEDFAVLVDGAVVSTFKPSGKSYQAYATASFTVTAGSHTIEFEGLDSVGGDNTALIDAVSIAVGSATPPPPPTGPTAGDAGFESVVVGNGNYAYDPTGSAWTFSGSAGVTANNSGFTSGNPSAPQGSQVGFLQNSGTITQSVSGFDAGSYTISFDAAQRGNDGVQAEDFVVLVDGAVVSTFKPSGKSYQAYTTASFTVTAGSHTIELEGLDSVGGDNTALIDAVAIAKA